MGLRRFRALKETFVEMPVQRLVLNVFVRLEPGNLIRAKQGTYPIPQ